MQNVHRRHKEIKNSTENIENWIDVLNTWPEYVINILINSNFRQISHVGATLKWPFL